MCLLKIDGLLSCLKLLVEVDDCGALLAADRLDNCSRAADNLAGNALLVELAEADPLAQELALRDADEGDAALCTERFNKLHIGSLVAVLCQKTEDGTAAIESSYTLAKTARNTVAGTGLFEDSFDGCTEIELSGNRSRFAFSRHGQKTKY